MRRLLPNLLGANRMIIAVEGRKYEGKTSLAFYLACKIRDERSAYKIMIFDPKWSFRNEYVPVLGKSRRVQHAESIDDFEEMVDSPGTAVSFWPELSMQRNTHDTIYREFESFCGAIGLEELLRHPPMRPVIILVDEAELLREGKEMHPCLSNAVWLATKGRLYLILAVHRPVQIAPDVRSQIDDFYFFRQDDPNDLAFIQERCGKAVADTVSTLPRHHFVHYSSEHREATLWNNPERWRIDIGEPSRSTASSNSSARGNADAA